jgi:[acyl-carrier-protein] S-malonyltransferase
MGKSLAESEPIAKQTFQEADELLGFPLSELCWDGPSESLNDTLNTQPAIFTHSIAVFRVLKDKVPTYSPRFTAGHSVGEFCALVASEAISFRDGLMLVHERGRLMREAGINNPGGMSAILGLSIEKVEEVLEQASSEGQVSVWVANDNCPGQVVVSGEETGLNDIEAQFSAAGAKKVVRLAVSIPSHSPLMAQMQDEFRRILDETPISDPQTPIIGNVQASVLKSAEEIRADLRDQLTSRVRWTDTVKLLTSMGVKRYYELGPGKVLSGLMRRIDRSNITHAIDTADSFSPFFEQVNPSISGD